MMKSWKRAVLAATEARYQHLVCLYNTNGEGLPEAIDAYLALGYVPAPGTAFKGINKLPPAHWLTLDLTPAAVAEDKAKQGRQRHGHQECQHRPAPIGPEEQEVLDGDIARHAEPGKHLRPPPPVGPEVVESGWNRRTPWRCA